jgi:Family of unknown function (DUF5682)
MNTAASPALLDQAFPAPAADAGKPLARIFGVRHLSPAAAHHLHAVLDTLRPSAVLVEGPQDATDQIQHLVHKDTQPPLALLAYTQDRPVRSILYPLAEYSPEWVALTWASRHKAEVRFIDLPAAVFLELHQITKAEEKPAEGETPPEPDNGDEPGKRRRQASEHTQAYLDDPYTEIARLAGDPDHETWWERHFEHTVDPVAYVRQIYEFGRGLRELRALKENDENLIREAFMRRCIREVLAKGHKPERVLVVCGAFHTPALVEELEPMSDKQVKALPRTKTSLTLMPYSYYRLSSQSGYGAGNHAPAYYQRLYAQRRAAQAGGLGSLLLAELVHQMRRKGHVRSAAEVIEGVRLAQTLAALAGSPAPCLRDWRDAAMTCLGRGSADVVRPFLLDLEIGDAVGRLPKGISRTAIQDDFYLQLDALQLNKYQTEKAQEVELDLRENRYVKSAEAAFRDRNRSVFLHRLQVLGVAFGEEEKAGQDRATWKEVWKLHWTPECEIQLIESALKGDTVEVAAAVRLSERLAECERVDQASGVAKEAARCQLADALEDARRLLQSMAVADTGFVHRARAVEDLAELIRYGSVWKVDPAPLKPLLFQLFLRAALQLRDACLCDRQAAPEIRTAILILHRVAAENAEDVDAARWQHELEAVAAADNLNPYLSGLACALILERGGISENELAREVSRRLSPGVPADLGAGWFEGLVSYNRMALFSRLALWRQLDAYLAGLDEEAFRSALVFLRRAFGDFDQSEVRRVVSNLVEVCSPAADQLKESVDVKLDEEEAKKLQELLGGLDL